jgi:hypothetical protein
MRDGLISPARLFTFAAVGFTVLAPFLEVGRGQPAFDLYIHDVYFVVPNWIFTLLAAAICGMFAILYFGCGRLLRIPLKPGLSLANFLLIVLPLVATIVELRFIHPNFKNGPESWPIKFFVISYVLQMICILTGCVVFVFNFSWTLVRVLRTRV